MPEAVFSAEVLPPDQYLGPVRYRHTNECLLCGHVYSWITSKCDGKDKPCPNKVCIEARRQADILHAAENMAKIFLEQRAPAHIGDNPKVHAVDKTAQIVMEDHHMTDLKDNVREGDTLVPPLPVTGASGMKMSSVAENFFGGAKALQSSGMSRQAQMLGQMAINGAFADRAANPGRLTPAPKGKPPLTLVRTEKI